MNTATDTADKFLTLTRNRDGATMPIRVTERKALQLRPTVLGEPRGEWLASHWKGCGYDMVDGEPITAANVVRLFEAALGAS